VCSKPSSNNKVKLIIGFIFKENEFYLKAINPLTRHFGNIDFESREIPFNHTQYYQKEFGKNLKRKFISFAKLIPPEKLAKIKALTNIIEKKLSSKGDLRRINIDPGYLDLAKVVLATTKDYKHRIYLNSGIYAEVTLFYRNKSFNPWEWTYPDYRTAEYLEIFNKIRQIYAQNTKR